MTPAEARGFQRAIDALLDDRRYLAWLRSIAGPTELWETLKDAPPADRFVAYLQALKGSNRVKCPCFYFEMDPDLAEEEDMVCACGHVLDEHDDQGECTVELDDPKE